MEHIQNKRNILEQLEQMPTPATFFTCKTREDIKHLYTSGKPAPASAVILRGNILHDRTLFPRPERGGMLLFAMNLMWY